MFVLHTATHQVRDKHSDTVEDHGSRGHGAADRVLAELTYVDRYNQQHAAAQTRKEDREENSSNVVEDGYDDPTEL